ncbi:MAG: GIY-YIG nuclease family protein [Oscillospiraceae bacterium]|nr:GIY-YIG nuclease family protein [Oscillospiraceae bacterium]
MYVYILKCGENFLYTGIAVNPEKRLRQHLGLIKGGAKFTKIHKVRCVAALWEDKSGEYARKLEYHLKKNLSHSQKQYLVENPHIPFSTLDFDVPDGEIVYVNPDYLNEKFDLL